MWIEREIEPLLRQRASSHDQYFFNRPEQMVASTVMPPRLDLGNEDLVRAHVQARRSAP